MALGEMGRKQLCEDWERWEVTNLAKTFPDLNLGRKHDITQFMYSVLFCTLTAKEAPIKRD